MSSEEFTAEFVKLVTRMLQAMSVTDITTSVVNTTDDVLQIGTTELSATFEDKTISISILVD